MPRLARKNIETEFIHVMVQGINKEYIFNESKYLLTYLGLIKDNIDYDSFSLLAYCMMSNHAHFLFHINNIEVFENYMHRVNQSFAQMYNKETKRVGVIFRNRYRVEPICDENYLINCINYIHNNPVEARMVKKPEEYPFSSYNDYVSKTGVSQDRLIKEILGNDFNAIISKKKTPKRLFMDNEKNLDIENYIESGMKSFLKEKNKDLVDILSSRRTLRDLLLFLKTNINIPYSEVGRYLGISINSLKYVLKE